MADTFDALIVGAGIVGAACALELARAGWSVGLVERDALGSGATAAGMGHIVVMDDSPAQMALTRYSQLLWDALGEAEPRATEYNRCGTLWVAADDEEMQGAAEKQAYYAASTIPSALLEARALYECEPNLGPGLAGGLLVPGDSVVYPPRAAQLLLREAGERARLIYADAVELVPGGVRLDNGSVLGAGAVVIANGARAVDLLPGLPIFPKKGHLAITDRYPGFIRHQLVELGYVKSAHSAQADSVAFNAQPRTTGQILIGSSRQIGAATREVDQVMLAKMLGRALEYLPGLAGLSCIRVWTGLRAATPDGLPLIGPAEDRPDVWLAAGHEGLGITTSLGTARLLAAQMCGRETDIPFEPYLPSRVLQGAAHV